MGTNRSFQDMLNEYLPNRLLREELVKRDYVLTKSQKDNSWEAGDIIVPFKGAGASSIRFGKLTAQNDVSEDEYVRGKITEKVEVWGTLKFNHRDLKMDHTGKIPEDTFLDVLTDTVEDFMVYMQEAVSMNITNGASFALVASDASAAAGIMVVDRIDRFMLGQKAVLDDDDSATVNVYVTAINLETSAITLSLTRGGAAANLVAYTVAQNAKFYHDGVWDGVTLVTFTSLKSALLSAANGGAASLHGVSKLAYPYLQAINIDGSTITASNIIEKIFDADVETKRKARGSLVTDILMSWKHLGSVMKLIEVQKGGFKVSENSKEASIYGWTTIEVTSVSGRNLKFVGIQEIDDDIIMGLDWRGMTLRSNGLFKKRISPDGREYYEVRAETGYEYFVDSALYGEYEVKKPGNNFIIYGISY